MASELLNDEVFEKFRRNILPSAEDTSHQDERPTLTFPGDIINEEKHERVSKFFQRADSLDTEKLLAVLSGMDTQNLVDLNQQSTVEVEATVVTFVQRILHRVGEIDPRLTSILLRGGSFYDGVKIGRPDEFDFTAKIQRLCSTIGLESRFSARKKGFVYVVIKDEDSFEDFSDFFVNPDDKDEILKSDEKILSVFKIKERFGELIDRALSTINVPKVLAPSCKNEGLSWHSVHHGPCATIYATYYSTALGEMSLDIDIAPTFDLPPPNYIPPVLNLVNMPCLSDGRNPLQSELLSKLIHNELKIMVVPFAFDKISEVSKGKTWSYEYSETWRVSFNALEQFVFSLYGSDSVEKQVYRVLKVLKESFIQRTPEIESKAGTAELRYEEPPSTKLTSVTIEPVSILSAMSIEPTDNWSEEKKKEI